MIFNRNLVNVVFAGVAALITNLIMLLAVYRSNRITKAFKFQMYASAVLCLFYTGINVFTNPTIAVLPVDRTVLFVKGGFETSYYLGLYLLDVFIFLIMLTALHPTVQFCHRYLHIVHGANRSKWDRPWLWLFVLIPIFLALSSAAFFCFQVEPTDVEIIRYNATTWYINGIGFTSFLVSSVTVITSPDFPTSQFDHDYTMLATIIYMTTCMFASSIVVIFTSISVSMAIRRKSPVLSIATVQMQKQLQKTLVAQALIPLITIHIPFYVCCFAPSLGWNIFFANEFFPFLFSYYSVLSPITVVYYCKDVRNIALALCRRVEKSNGSNSGSTLRGAWAIS